MLSCLSTTVRPVHRSEPGRKAYGLGAGYDGSKKLATVNHTMGKSNSKFKSVWTVAEKSVTNYSNEKAFTAIYNGSANKDEFIK